MRRNRVFDKLSRLLVALFLLTPLVAPSSWAMAAAQIDRIDREIRQLNQEALLLAINPLYAAGGRTFDAIELEIANLSLKKARIVYVDHGEDPTYGDVEPLGNAQNNSTVVTALGFSTELTAAGYSETGNRGPYHAIIWTLSGGTVDLGTLPGGDDSQAYGISADASVVVGVAATPLVSNGGTAFRWTAADYTMTNMGSLNGPTGRSQALATNGDGTVVTGDTDVPNADPTTFVPEKHAFRWVVTPGLNTGVMTDLDPTYAFTSSSGRAISLDGSVIVGSTAERTTGTEAMRWTLAGGMTALPTMAGASSMIANAVSGDGQIVVGTASTDTFVQPEGRLDIDGSPLTSAFRWTAASGTQDLAALLASAGVDMTGQLLISATGITADGQFIAGTELVAGTTNYIPYLARYCDAANAGACTASVGGMTTSQSLTDSLAQLSDQHNSLSAQLSGTTELLLGGLQPVQAPDSGGPFASVGSFSLGAAGRYNLNNDFSVLGGASLVEQSAGGATVSGAALFGAAVRYVHPVAIVGEALRPFVEAGAWGSPSAGMHFTRNYANGSGTATGEGDAVGSVFGLYARGGVLYAPTLDDELAFSVTLARNWLNIGAYAEATSPGNPFPASFAASTSASNEVKATVQWTRKLRPDLDLTLTGSIGRSFGGGNGTTGSIAGIGELTGTSGDYSFGQIGARLALKATSDLTLDAFVLGTVGDRIGSHVQFGGGFSVAF